MSRRKWVGSMLLVALVATAGLMLVNKPTEARPGGPGLLCGFTTLWNCDLPLGPDVQISGTVCEINQFEQQTGATCVPAGF